MEEAQHPGNPSASGPPRFTLTDNLARIDQIKRMWRAQWPEFSWLTVPGEATSRCYQLFAPDISRVGYGELDATTGQYPCWQSCARSKAFGFRPSGARSTSK
jgi:hypothetical protein